MSCRSAIVLLLATATLASGCDRTPQPPQATPANDGPANDAAVTAADGVPAPDEVAAAPAAAPAAKLDRSHKGEAAPATGFTLDGKSMTLADFRGKPVLVNLWATWCAPCVAEMPTLERLAGRMQVAAISQDLEGAKKVAPFFADRKFVALKPYLDTKAALSMGYQANLPMTILYDASGKEVWRWSGGNDWTSAPATALIAEAG